MLLVSPEGKKTPLFTVIVPTYNRGHLLPRALRSVQQQYFENWELIVVDDGSTDHTRELVLALGDARIRYFFQENRGRSAARNLGIRQSRGSFICFLDDDDYYLRHHLSSFADLLDSGNYSDYLLRTGMYSIGLGRLRIYPQYSKQAGYGHPLRYFLFHHCSLGTLCIPRTILRGIAFSEELEDWEDTHLICRLLARYPLMQLNALTYAYRKHPEMGSLKHYPDVFAMMDQLNRVEVAMEELLADEKVAACMRSDDRSRWLSKQYLLYLSQALEFLDARAAETLLGEIFSRHLWYFFPWDYVKVLGKWGVKKGRELFRLLEKMPPGEEFGVAEHQTDEEECFDRQSKQGFG